MAVVWRKASLFPYKKLQFTNLNSMYVNFSSAYMKNNPEKS